MRITKLEIHNYRNLDGVKIFLAEDCNFIVGENNLGKSNLLNLLSILFTARAFKLDDFADKQLPIEISLRIKLSSMEIGHFQDLFELDDYTTINLSAKQQNPDDNISFYHTETATFIQSSIIKCVNYIYYESLRNPVTEINFDKGRGVGRFLRNIISNYLETQGAIDSDFIDDNKVTKLLASVNEKILKIKSFKDFGIKAHAEDDVENLLSKLVVLRDSKGENLFKSGYGVQFLILVTLSILEKLQTIRNQRGDRGVFENPENGTKSISLIIGLDEPEIHLHPYMQRSLIKYLNSVINNQNADFTVLVKELFDIDEFIGQILIVTHSPNILLNDYKQIVRFYSLGGSIKIVSGSQLNLDPQLQKHLYLNFPFIKEAFFSRSAIFVEGDTEFSSFPHFGTQLSIEFDDLGICVIQARGDAIHQLIELANMFGIPSIGVTDKDDGLNPPSLPNHFETNLRDFESELITLIDLGKEAVLRKILCEYDSQGINRVMDIKALNKRAYSKHKIASVQFTSDLKLADIQLVDTLNLKAFYITWFSINKSYPLGLIIGKTLSLDEIPAIYKTVIAEAKKLVENV